MTVEPQRDKTQLSTQSSAVKVCEEVFSAICFPIVSQISYHISIMVAHDAFSCGKYLLHHIRGEVKSFFGDCEVP